MKKYQYILLVLFFCCFSFANGQDCDGKLVGKSVCIENLSTVHDGNNMFVSMDLCLDSLKLSTNSRIVFTPVVRLGGRGVKMPEIVINGRRQQIMYERGIDRRFYNERAVIVKRDNGNAQRISYQAVIPFEKWMKNYDVEIFEDLCGCGDSLDRRRVLVRRHRVPVIAFMRPAAEAEKIRHIDKRAYIDFPVDKITLYPEYRRNPAELDSIINTINIVKNDSNITIKNIEIHGFASPESPYSHNDYLARNRAVTLKDYVCRLVCLDDSIFSVSHTPEDWEGLCGYLSESNLEHKAEILAICNDKMLDPDSREWKIKSRYPDEYRFMLSTWYPALRHSDYHISYSVRPFSVDEARNLLQSKPQQLSLSEMFMVAQTYEPGSKEFNEVMEIAVRMYPEDETANINAACTRLSNGDTAGAEKYLDKAGDSARAKYTRGIKAMIEGDKDKARLLLEEASEEGVKEADENLMILDLE